MLIAVSDLPLPDSPTMPIILFFGTENSISDNANFGVGRIKLTLSLKTDNKGVKSMFKIEKIKSQPVGAFHKPLQYISGYRRQNRGFVLFWSANVLSEQ